MLLTEKIQELEKIAIQRMQEFNLLEEGWFFEWSKKKRSLGDCNHGKKRIRLSEYFAGLVSTEDLIDTINHEIAHAIVGRGHGHDHVWREACIKTGANPERIANKQIIGERKFKWTGKCPSCGGEHNRYRLTRSAKTASCGKCTKSFDPNLRLIWVENF
jgi:predicted SprT family Zn-dependent metalloprotease